MSGELRALAEAARDSQPHAWDVEEERETDEPAAWFDPDALSSRNVMSVADSHFIAAANPTTVLGLLDEVEALRAERDHWKIHAEEAGAGFAQVCRDAARLSARNVELCRERDDLYAQLGPR